MALLIHAPGGGGVFHSSFTLPPPLAGSSNYWLDIGHRRGFYPRQDGGGASPAASRRRRRLRKE